MYVRMYARGHACMYTISCVCMRQPVSQLKRGISRTMIATMIEIERACREIMRAFDERRYIKKKKKKNTEHSNPPYVPQRDACSHARHNISSHMYINHKNGEQGCSKTSRTKSYRYTWMLWCVGGMMVRGLFL